MPIQPTGTRQSILEALKREGPLAIAQLAERLAMSGEAVRQQLVQLQREGWIEALHDRAAGRHSGRPAARYRLTQAGDHVFPKHYDALTVAVLDAVSSELGPEALDRILASLTDARARVWEQRLAGKSVRERVEALRGVYEGEDPFMEAEEVSGGFRLIEHNCPFLNVALERPALCSLTVSLLSRLLGFEVVREERFQSGDGRCSFRVLMDKPRAPDAPPFQRERKS
ncbi:MAG TPA: winged helix-turn-helix transcriptional regulator [Myxococcales bacterium]|nr:winged helix-turn-helix transcriptional regulator [Myxococcales bacterium]